MSKVPVSSLVIAGTLIDQSGRAGAAGAKRRPVWAALPRRQAPGRVSPLTNFTSWWAARVRAGRQRGYSLAIVTQRTEIILTRQRQRRRSRRERAFTPPSSHLSNSPISHCLGRWAGGQEG